jgi:hypothetical protein
MSIEKTRAQLVDLLRDADNKVVALTGRWGTGKTYLWENVRSQSEDEKVQNSLYASLFGLSTVDQIKRKLMEVALPGAEEHGGAVDAMKNMLKVGFKALSEHYKGLAAINDLNLVLMAPAVLREKLIVIDDIERKHEKLGVDEVLGFVDEYSKRYGVRFLLLLNDDQLSSRPEQDELWATFREKVIDREIKLSTTPEEAFAIAIQIWPSNYENALPRAVISCGLTNIRIAGKVIRAVNHMLADRNLSVAIQSRVVPSIVLFSSIHYHGLEDGPDFQFALNIANPGWMRSERAKGAEPTEQEMREDRWRMLMGELGIHGCDDFEKVLVEYLESGLFEGDYVQAIIERYVAENESMQALQTVRSFMVKAIWDHRATDADLLAEAAGFPGVANLLDPYVATELHDILDELAGGHACGDQVIQAWLATYQTNGACTPNDDNPFGRPLHPDIQAAFDAAHADAQAQATVVEAITRIVEHRSWSTMQEVTMKRASTADFESAIRGMGVDELPKFMRRMIEMRLQRATYDSHFGTATERFMDACRAIANDEAPGSARLAKLMKRLFEKTALASELNPLPPQGGQKERGGLDTVAARKIDVHSYVGSDLAQFRTDEHLLPADAQLAVILEWPGSPAGTPQESYWLFADAKGSAWYMSITTSSPEGEQLYADGGWLEPSDGIDAKAAANRILMKIWQDEAKLDEFRGPDVRVAKVGLLTEDHVRRIVQSIQR